MKYSFLIALLFPLAACTSEPLPPAEQPQEPPVVETPDAYRDKIRTQPYPKTDNELMLNPPPLIVPQAMKTGEALEFALSRSESFDTPETILSAPRTGCFFNPHRALEAGTWYWRFRSTAADGSNPGAWSEPVPFEVTGAEPEFVTPPFDDFRTNAPRYYPRLYCFLNPHIDEARRKAASHPEYKALQARAATALVTDYQVMGDLCARASDLRNHATWLYQAACLTQQPRYADKLRELLETFCTASPSDGQLFADNFTSSDVAICCLLAYDLLHDSLAPTGLSAAEELLMRVLRRYYKENPGYQENHIFDNHFWQQNMRTYFQIAFLLYDHPAYADEVLPMLEYYYELWTARAPAGGFNRDGLWHNGTGYFNANVKTLAYMPALLSYVARKDFLQHPWYQNAGQALAYSMPPAGRNSGFGDGSEQGDGPNRLTAAFADYLARETGDGYAGWYAAECQSLVQQDYELRLYRMCAARSYDTALPENAPNLIWYKDIGEVAMHSRPGQTENNLTLSFRSSTYGSGSHTTASQNAFNLLYRGADVYRSSGYYQNFSDAHNLMSYRHTRAHNTILVNGIGQPYSTQGYGYVARALGGSHIGYCLGDASKAYSGISDDPMWVNNFAQAGIAQTPENGFGPTPLTKYRRHVLMLYPDIVVLYDELEASEPVRWDWLLHSPTAFEVDTNGQIIYSRNEAKQFVASTQLFCKENTALSVTDHFRVPPAISGEAYPNQWHLTAQVSDSRATRLLAIMQVRDEAEGLSVIRREGNTFRIGDWVIEAELDAEAAALLKVSNRTHPATFGYGVNGSTVSALYDEANGSYRTTEMTDLLPASTRAVQQ
ncbi:DUF4962 domain-containing protein [Bacteroides uniformis]|nr:DUF4962 domain-containing protein [Bacteroides uniformis]